MPSICYCLFVLSHLVLPTVLYVYVCVCGGGRMFLLSAPLYGWENRLKEPKWQAQDQWLLSEGARSIWFLMPNFEPCQCDLPLRKVLYSRARPMPYCKLIKIFFRYPLDVLLFLSRSYFSVLTSYPGGSLFPRETWAL